MRLIKFFTELNKGDTRIAGGKGASLGEMTRAGILVPPGFVVLVDAFERFAEETDLTQEIASIMKTVNIEVAHTVEAASEQIQALILSREMPEDIKEEALAAFQALGSEFVAVRSSATNEDSLDAAWAGQLDSFLNTTEKTLFKNIQRCWASLFTPRAIFYRFEKGLHDQFVSVAVVVQKMVNADTSGIAFSVHPVTEDRNQIIIEAGFGLGEAVVSGAITPDSYVITKEPREIIDINTFPQSRALCRKEEGGNEWRELGDTGSKQVLTEEQIKELSEIILAIEDHYKFPCDIEWAMEAGSFSIVQSRPITTLASVQSGSNRNAEQQKKNYIYSWGGKGFTLLFMSLLLHSLKRFDFVHAFCVGRNGELKVYWTQGARKAAEEYGRKIYTHMETAKDHTAQIHECANLLEKYSDIGSLDLSAFQEYIDDAKNFLALYMTLDPEFTNEILEDIQDDRILIFLGEEKNSLREKINELFFVKDSAYQHVLDVVSKEVGIQRDHAENFSLEELELMLKNKEYSNGYDSRDFLIALKEGVIEYSFDDSQIAMMWDTPSEEDPSGDSGELKGVSVAKKGVYRGKVRICDMDYTDLASEIRRLNEEQGDFIFVADHTTPELVPIMKKSLAIVTNMGGVLSHAAITSRELELPCVVGTVNATKALKNDDEVEVDANTGRVKILKQE